jgi:dimeric dUTPase (all-alpha-NTP-PPase superfamily)
MEDMLVDMYMKQVKLQARLNPDTVLIRNQPYINIMSLALIDEVMEAVRETPWKPWKKQQGFDEENFKKELIDCQHFLFNLMIAAGMSAAEIHGMFMEKNNENHSRQDNNY